MRARAAARRRCSRRSRRQRDHRAEQEHEPAEPDEVHQRVHGAPSTNTEPPRKRSPMMNRSSARSQSERIETSFEVCAARRGTRSARRGRRRGGGRRATRRTGPALLVIRPGAERAEVGQRVAADRHGLSPAQVPDPRRPVGARPTTPIASSTTANGRRSRRSGAGCGPPRERTRRPRTAPRAPCAPACRARTPARSPPARTPRTCSRRARGCSSPAPA